MKGTGGYGIQASNGSSATNLSVTTGQGSSVTGYKYGIYTAVNGSGANTTLTLNGTVSASSRSAVFATTYGNNLTITTGAQSNISGGNGIRARNKGTGYTSITTNGTVIGAGGAGIFAYNSSTATQLTITTGVGSKVVGIRSGIYANQQGSGAFTITNSGVVANGSYNGTTKTFTYNANGTAIVTASYSNAVTLNNQGTGQIIGTITLGGTGNSFTNAGTWRTSGNSNFYYGASSTPTTISNTGSIYVSPPPSGTSTFNVGGTFTNSGLLSISTQTANNGVQPNNNLVINGNFASSGGTLKIDAYLGATGSKASTLTVNGNVTGTTKVSVVNTNKGLGALNTGIVFATVNGKASANSFALANGPIKSGLYVYNIKELTPTTTQEVFELYSTAAVNANGLAQVSTGSEVIFYDALEKVFQHLGDGNLLSSPLGNQQDASLGNGIVAHPVSSTPGSDTNHGLWGKLLGNAVQWGQGGPQGYSLGTGGFIAGLDGKLDNSNFTFGIDAGYIRSYQNFNSGDYANADGLLGGVYASYNKGKFRTDLLLGAMFTNMGYVQSGVAGTVNYASISTYGGSIESGYKIPLKGSFYAEPVARMAVATTNTSNGAIAGTPFSAGGTSVRGAVGVNFKGQVLSSSQADVVYRPSVGFKVYQEFGQQSSATFGSNTVYDLAPNTFGEMSVGMDILNLSTDWTGTISGTGRIADQYLSIGGAVSLRKDF